MLRATVSGSFRRHMSAVYDAVTELIERNVAVLSPADPRVVDQIGEFVFVASDRVRSIKMVQDRHLECIRASHFLWLVSPDGYVGQSASMEVGYAVANGIPVLSQDIPLDGTLQRYVHSYPSLAAAIAALGPSRREIAREGFLISPIAAIDEAQQRLARIRADLARPAGAIRDSEAAAMLDERETVARLITSEQRPGKLVAV